MHTELSRTVVCHVMVLHRERQELMWAMLSIQPLHMIPLMASFVLEVIKALTLALSLETGVCIHNYVILNRSISNGKGNLHKPNITHGSTSSNIKEAGISPKLSTNHRQIPKQATQQRHRSPCKQAAVQPLQKISACLSFLFSKIPRILGFGSFNSLADSRGKKIIKLNGKLLESKASPVFMFQSFCLKCFLPC